MAVLALALLLACSFAFGKLLAAQISAGIPMINRQPGAMDVIIIGYRCARLNQPHNNRRGATIAARDDEE